MNKQRSTIINFSLVINDIKLVDTEEGPHL